VSGVDSTFEHVYFRSDLETEGGPKNRDLPYFGGARGARRIRRLTDARIGSQNTLTTPQVAPSVFPIRFKWHPDCALVCHFLFQDWVPVPNQGAQPPPAESCRPP